MILMPELGKSHCRVLLYRIKEKTSLMKIGKIKKLGCLNKIISLFFEHEDVHKLRWAETGSKSSIIDCIIVDKKLYNEVLVTRVFRGTNVNSEKFMTVFKSNLRAR